jgi:hypothetical protein
MRAETLDVDFYRQRAYLCHHLAKVAPDAPPLFARLYLLARAYEDKATASESAGGKAAESSSSPNDPTSPPSIP